MYSYVIEMVKFRFQGRFVHLTYKHHLCIDCIKKHFDKCMKDKVYKIKVA